MTLEEAKTLVEFCQGRNIKSVAYNGFAVEFFPKEAESMNLDPVALSKALTESLPPDSSMLFASAEDMTDNLTPPLRDNVDMT